MPRFQVRISQRGMRVPQPLCIPKKTFSTASCCIALLFTAPSLSIDLRLKPGLHDFDFRLICQR